MRPVTFAKDCAACHTMDVSVGVSGPISVPHGVQPPAIREVLRNAVIGRAMSSMGASPGRERALPGRAEHAAMPDGERVDDLVKKADRQLFGAGKGVCTECHRVSGPVTDPRIAPAAIRTSWLAHARFDHPSHRGVSCRECHSAAYPGKDASRTSSDVILPAKATCARCHAPEGRGADGLAFGGAGHSCTECHRYHGGDHGPRTPTGEAMTIRAFLLGVGPGTK